MFFTIQILINLSQLSPAKWAASTTIVKIADMMLLIYFILDPFVYVLQNCLEGHVPCYSRGKDVKKLIITTTPLSTPTIAMLDPPVFQQSSNV